MAKNVEYERIKIRLVERKLQKKKILLRLKNVYVGVSSDHSYTMVMCKDKGLTVNMKGGQLTHTMLGMLYM